MSGLLGLVKAQAVDCLDKRALEKKLRWSEKIRLADWRFMPAFDPFAASKRRSINLRKIFLFRTQRICQGGENSSFFVADDSKLFLHPGQLVSLGRRDNRLMTLASKIKIHSF